MSVPKRLFKIFGPIILAAILLLAVLLSPFSFGLNHVSKTTEKKAAVSLSPNILKGRLVKRQALDDGYVPFFGSSEWSRFDPMHPSVLADKYQRNYRPFLLGARGTQSLTQYFVMQSVKKQLTNKKAVFVISPQWFVPKGTRKDAFGYYYSPLQTTDWLQTEQNTAMDRYAAKRLLQMPSGSSDRVLSGALARVAAGLEPTSAQRAYINYKARVLGSEDEFFSKFGVSGKNLNKVATQEKQLPATYNYTNLDALAGKLGQQATTSNNLEISNTFWQTQLKRHYKRLKGSQTTLDYTKSPEFADFQLVLNQFAKNHTDVAFIIPPINQKWANYTGLSMKMMTAFDKKIRYQLTSQGFNNIIDLSKDGQENYFMTDTIHLGWRGWLAVDQKLDPFLSKSTTTTPSYQINDAFYTKQWQQLNPNAISAFEQQ
ncbi:D-alanyl-lipoteichoic acid biosynthesis protein DltD [Lactobacillus sp. CBA3606]|uniref:D-alanyl-lipoteichoic acid biosynthesis protein DltD n=1 Tax=Lactobacillus sp. CBA3606 TaxID=2099789 RepID=UPI000CFAF1C5|nr:D-alanyl-lipoteichoic acid biosynthesis protein DltD [Lactobacillus sp. CBA3606]AVK63135.1 D-alanyl-lipoteichoic acid biosynthesis protein DltD [Lactobacillus sp. CBA3606]